MAARRYGAEMATHWTLGRDVVMLDPEGSESCVA
jgi:hypothetical protein